MGHVTARAEEAARWSRVDHSIGTSVDLVTRKLADPLRGHRQCERCGQRGPLVPEWRRVFGGDVARAAREAPRWMSETYVCADQCAARVEAA